MSSLLIFLQRLNPLQDGRVGVVPGGVQPVVDREAEVVVVELHQRARQVRGLAQLGRELVRLELEVAGEDAHQEADDGGVGGGDVLEDDHEADQHRL